jgi:hypothetical protein
LAFDSALRMETPNVVLNGGPSAPATGLGKRSRVVRSN